jgi:hypothetical protein
MDHTLTLVANERYFEELIKSIENGRLRTKVQHFRKG